MTSSRFLRLSAASLACIASLAGIASAATTRGVPVLDIPRPNCAGSTQTSIDLNIQAGASGAPFGFIVEWAETRPNGSCPKWGRLDRTCHATFTPLSANSPFGLGPYWQVVVHIGALDLTNPEITATCTDALRCGTTYCFRVKAVGGSDATHTFARSDWSDEATCTTLDCTVAADICTYTQGAFGAPPNGGNPATLLLDPSFPYPVALCDLSFDDQASIEAYLPHGGTPGPITNDFGGGSLAGQILAARINMIISAKHLHATTCCTQTGASGSALGDLKLCLTDPTLTGLNGLTVGDAVDQAEQALCSGQLPSGVSDFGTLASIIEQINLDFHGEDGCTDGGQLCTP